MLAESVAIQLGVTVLGAAVYIAIAYGGSPVPTTSCAMALAWQFIRMPQRLWNTSMYYTATAW